MSRLDKKLREILTPKLPTTIDTQIIRLKQAFADEGYIVLQPLTVKSSDTDATDLMTGQDWYDRFVQEWLSIHRPDLKSIEILEAAKKAAGVK